MQGGLIFVCGRLDGLLKVAGRRHNTDDLIATVLAVEPHRFVYRQRYAVAVVHLLLDQLINFPLALELQSFPSTSGMKRGLLL